MRALRAELERTTTFSTPEGLNQVKDISAYIMHVCICVLYICGYMYMYILYKHLYINIHTCIERMVMCVGVG